MSLGNMDTELHGILGQQEVYYVQYCNSGYGTSAKRMLAMENTVCFE